jgi:hypothetical protein
MFQRQQSSRLEVGAGIALDLEQMTSNMMQLEELAAQVRAHGVDAVVLSRFSDNPTADILEQAEVLDVNLLLVPSDSDADVPQLVASAPTTVGVWDADQVNELSVDAPVLVVARSGSDGDSALALAIRWARARGSALQLVDGGRRRLSGLIDRLQKLGVDAQQVPEASISADAVALLPIDGEPPQCAGSFKVRATKLRDESELSELLENLPATLPAQASPSSAPGTTVV